MLAEALGVADRQRFEYRYGYLQTRPADVANDLRAQGACVECFNLDNNVSILLGARRIARYIEEHDIKLVHAHLPLAGFVARLAGRLKRVPVVYTEHSPIERYHPIVRRLNVLSWRWQDQVFAISRDVEESIRRHCGGSVPVRTIWNGVNTDRFAPDIIERADARRRIGIPEDALVVGTVAVLRPSPAKRLDIWLDAARIVREREPRAEFVIVGDGSQREQLEARAKALGLADAVRFVGKQEDVRPYLAALDVFLMSSAYEGFGIALVEAMAMGVPVVATNVEGVRNIVTSGESGLLCAFDEHVAENLADRTLRLLADPALRTNLAAAGREVAVERFSIGRMQAELEAIYGEVVAANERYAA